MIFNFNRGFNDGSLKFGERPIIAISANIMDENSALHFAYSQSVVDAGGVPVIIPANCNAEAITSLMRGVDGLLLSGGDDIDGAYFGEENIPDLTELNEQRDYYEFMLLRAAIDCSLPIFGICRGCQVINIALGGTIYQDLPTMYSRQLEEHKILTNKHIPVHEIKIEEGSMLHTIIGQSSIGVNSRHHQAIKDLAPSLRVNATSHDGVIEGIEGYPTHKIIALQCHPENLATTGESAPMRRLFSFFISEADLYRQAKRIHTLNPIVDSHCDTPMLYDEGGFNFFDRNSGSRVDLVKMQEGYLDTTITVAYIPQSTPANQARDKAISILNRFRDDLAAHVTIARTPSDIVEAKSKGLKSVMLGVENGLAIGDDVANIDLFKQMGVVYITLCHNGSNAICDSAKGDALHDGVSEFGAAVIRRMNRLGITVDVSHSSDKSTLDTLAISTQPIIASHSSCRALCDHPRNLSDSTIKAIAAKGGVVQVCGYSGFLRSGKEEATLLDMVDHIEHTIRLTGYDHVGIGSDFDGGGGIVGFNGSNDFIGVSVELLRRGHSAEGIAKVMGGNILRVLKL
ncbi:MAG: membrane dipeptidase [Rikenellaceae bacterium]